MESPFARGGDSVMWNGPSTVLSVPSVCPLIVSTSIDTPSTSESRMNSCRVSSHFCPTAVRNSIAACHSGSVSRVSRTNACRCGTSRSRSSRSRASGVSAKLCTTAAVAVSSLKSIYNPRSRSAFPCAIFARSASLIGAVRRNCVAVAMSSNG